MKVVLNKNKARMTNSHFKGSFELRDEGGFDWETPQLCE